jgi:hypothetical protein
MILRFLFLSFAIFTTISSDEIDLGREAAHPAQFAQEEGAKDPSLVLYGVHLFSGQYSELVQDMISPSSIPIKVERSFSGPQFHGGLGGGWNWNWQESLTFLREKKKHHHKHWKTTYHGPWGMELEFDFRERDRKKQSSPLYAKGRKGETNGRSWILSGKSNLHNLSLFFDDKRKKAVIRNGAGDNKIFFVEGVLLLGSITSIREIMTQSLAAGSLLIPLG